MEHNTKLLLPSSVIGTIDVGRLVREIENVNESLLQLKLREPGTEVRLPKTSQILDQIALSNQLNMLHDDDRELLLNFLKLVRDKAPIIHISFSAEPSPDFLEKLMTWLRREIDPLLLLIVGIQPNIGAGCVVRTTNRYFDLSLKQNFVNKKGVLVEKLFPKTAPNVPTPVNPTAGA